MDAVLPLTLRDVPRAKLLLASLARRFEGLGTLWLACPDSEQRAIERELLQFNAGLSLEIVAESSLVPEVHFTPWLKGWYRQQLLKLAVHQKVTSDLYLTLDADVICTKHVTPALIAPYGLAPCHTLPRDLHPDWYRGSEAVLGLRAKRRGISHNVTPAVLHRTAVAELAEYLEGRSAHGFRAVRQRLLTLIARQRSWRLLLAASTPWTEYALYYTFLEATGRFDRFHFHSHSSLYDADGSFWRADGREFATWTPDAALQGEGAPWFVVVQSNTGVTPEQVAAKLEGCFAHG